MLEINSKSFILSLSFEDYTTGQGGTDKLIREHQRVLNAGEISLLHIFPIHKDYIEKAVGYSIWGVLIDGNFKGYFSTNQVIRILSQLSFQYSFKGIILHHFQWSNIDEIDRILNISTSSIICYLHDFMTICPNGGLIKNDQEFCGSEFPNKQKCKSCVHHSNKNIDISIRIRELFKKYFNRIKFIAPSEVCRDIWLETFPEYKNAIYIVPHQVFKGQYKDNYSYIENDNIRVAFVGYQKELKGWSEWVDSCNLLKENRNYQLFQFGKSQQILDGVQRVEVDFHKKETSMVQRLREFKIDCAVLWSKVPETYSFTYFEAMSANCFILTNENSGNIANMVRYYNNGYVASYDEKLASILGDTKHLSQMINSFRTKGSFGPLELEENNEIVDIINRLHPSIVEVHGEDNIREKIISQILLAMYRLRKH